MDKNNLNYDELLDGVEEIDEAGGNINSGRAQHALEDKSEMKAHAAYMKNKHGVTTKYHGNDEVSYHGPKKNVQSALKNHYGGDTDHAKEEHPHVFKEAHDLMNAEKKSVDSVDKAAKTGPRAKKRHADKSGGDKAMPKPDKGIVRELYDRINEMTKEEQRKLRDVLFDESFDLDSMDENEYDELEDVSYDMSEDISDLVSSEATLSEEFKDKASVIMEMAVKSKVKEEVAKLQESYDEQLEEAITEHTEDMVEKVDSYLNYVVENWMEENRLAVSNGLRTEIAENFMNSLKDLFVESYIEVPEEKVDLVDDLAEQVDALNEELNKNVDKMITMAEKLEDYERDSIIIEMSADLADTQIDKLVSLSENVDFDDEESFREKLETIKETYFGKKSKTPTSQSQLVEEYDEDEDETVDMSSSMAAYVNALKKSNH